MKSFQLILTLSLILILNKPSMSYEGPCKSDVEKFCKDVKPGEGRIIKCLIQHENEVSEACKKAHAQKKEMRNEMRAACHGDVEKLCEKGEHPMHCLKRNETKLSAGCKSTIEKYKTIRANASIE